MSDSSVPTPKLTKKQRKTAEFRKGASGSKGKKRDVVPEDVPEDDLVGDGEEQRQVGGAAAAGAESKDASSSSSKKKKRKRDGEAENAEDKAPSASTSAKKLSFDENGEAVESPTLPTKKKLKRRKKNKIGGTTTDADGNETPRLIVFVGNMSFKTPSEKIRNHFESHCGEAPTVRLLTTRSDSSKISSSKLKSIQKGKAADPTVRSKGCAFLQFSTAAALQKALGLHHTQFEGRLINVELTAGGGGSGTERKKKIQEKNAKLEVERSKLHEKYWKPQDDARKATSQDKRERGEDVGPPRKKSAKGEEGQAQWGTRRGAGSEQTQQQQQSKKRMPKWMASGANAVRLQD